MNRMLIVLSLTLVAASASAKKDKHPPQSTESACDGMLQGTKHEMHMFNNIEDAMAAMKTFVTQGNDVKMTSYKWTPKDQTPTIKYVLTVPK